MAKEKTIKVVKTSKGIRGAVELASRNKFFSLSDKLLEKKSVRDFIIDELTKPSDDRQTRRDIIFDIVKEYYMSRPNAYKIYNQVISEVNPKQSFTKYEIQMYLYDEYSTAIDAAYDQDEYDIKAIAMLLAGAHKLMLNWVDMPTEREALPIPIYSNEPKLLPNYKIEMEGRIEALKKKLRKEKEENIQDVSHEDL